MYHYILFEQNHQGATRDAKVPRKLAAIPCQTEESAHFLDRGQSRLLCDIVGVLVVSAHVISAGLMPQVRQSRPSEGALAPFDLELVVMKLLENLAQRTEVLLLGGVVDKDVVDKDQHPMAIEWCQNCVHAPLEGSRPAGKTIHQHLELEVAVVSLEGRLVFVLGLHTWGKAADTKRYAPA